jgi:hypothetical protein
MIVIRTDTHKASHTAAAVDEAMGQLLGASEAPLARLAGWMSLEDPAGG